MNPKLEQKLAELPKDPGVYFHKNAKGDIIYIGKAASLRSRVRQYFQKSRYRDPKTDVLIAEIADVEWVTVETELDALFLEAELVRRYMPPYNILLRDDKSLEYVRIDYKSDYPTVTTVRRPLDDGAEYFGPYISGVAVKRALRLLRRIFPFALSRPTSQKRVSLYYHLGLDPGLEEGKTELTAYKANLRKLMRYLRGERGKLIKEIENDMRRAAKAKEYEEAARLRNQLFSLQHLSKQIIFSDSEFIDASKDRGLAGLAELLSLKDMPRRIEGFDISHAQGTDNAASMVVFSNGIPDKTNYRKFKLRLPGNDDFAHMNEAISRRLSDKNRKDWGVPSLFLIDGGKGQLGAALQARDAAGQAIPMVGLAKREEEIVMHKTRSVPGTSAFAETVRAEATKVHALVTESDDYIIVMLPKASDIVKLLQRIRDESHRFAVSYHSSLKRSRQTKSLLDEVPGIGPATRKKLLRHFGSLKALREAPQNDVAALIGTVKAKVLASYLAGAEKSSG
jgi:excinuclease ABC subunit C